jgi:hypothetical protein
MDIDDTGRRRQQSGRAPHLRLELPHLLTVQHHEVAHAIGVSRLTAVT